MACTQIWIEYVAKHFTVSIPIIIKYFYENSHPESGFNVVKFHSNPLVSFQSTYFSHSSLFRAIFSSYSFIPVL